MIALPWVTSALTLAMIATAVTTRNGYQVIDKLAAPFLFSVAVACILLTTKDLKSIRAKNMLNPDGPGDGTESILEEVRYLRLIWIRDLSFLWTAAGLLPGLTSSPSGLSIGWVAILDGVILSLVISAIRA